MGKTKKEKIIISDLLLIILSSTLDSEPTTPKPLSSSKKHCREEPSINILLTHNKVRIILDYYKGTLIKRSKY
jgi:hypothetical protein